MRDSSVGKVSTDTSREDPILSNHILISTQRLSPIDSWNFDVIISFTFRLEDLTNCKYLVLIFGANRSILLIRRFSVFSRRKECFNFLIGGTLLYNLELGFKRDNLGLQLILGRYFGRLLRRLVLLVINIFPVLELLTLIQFGTFLLS